jgi:hypothetical protein
MIETSPAVAPTSRVAAKRRAAADRRVADPMKITTGKIKPAAVIASMRSMPFGLIPMS